MIQGLSTLTNVMGIVVGSAIFFSAINRLRDWMFGRNQKPFWWRREK